MIVKLLILKINIPTKKYLALYKRMRWQGVLVEAESIEEGERVYKTHIRGIWKSETAFKVWYEGMRKKGFTKWIEEVR